MFSSEEERVIWYKIDTTHSYKIWCQEYGGVKYYKIQIQKKNYDGTKTNFYKQVRFAKCTPPEDGEIIKIKKGFEDVRENKNDKYNPIWEVVILDYELENNDIVREQQAYETYQERLSENDEVNIDEHFLD